RREQETAGRELGVVAHIVEVALPTDQGPCLATEAETPVEQVDRVADRVVLRLPVRLADALIIASQEEIDARAAERTHVLNSDVDGILVHGRRLAPDMPRVNRLLDLAVRCAVAQKELEVVREPGSHVELEPLILDLAEAAEVLRRALRQE